MKCDHCGGAGKSPAFIKPAVGECYWADVACSDCGGTGEVTQAMLDAKARGAAMRQDRIARRVSLRDEANRLGITPVELSAREHGR